VADSVQNDARRKEVFDMGKTIAEDLIETGLQTGLQTGELRTRRSMLVEALQHKFGKIPASTLKRIEATEKFELLNRWFKQALDARKLDDVSFDAK
jgi:hypothetical protein